jgi:hypothetical protein
MKIVKTIAEQHMNLKKIIVGTIAIVVLSQHSFAGNPDRAGEAGAFELTVNPWGRSSGFNGMYASRVEGLESMNLNVAGLTFTKGTEIAFSRTQWLQGSGVNFNAAGIAQAIGKDKDNVIGLTFTSVGIGEIERTTYSSPEGGQGTFSPSFLNIALSYARSFNESIKGGVAFRLVNQRIDDLTASGFAFDAGLMYVTGKRDNVRFGVSLRNVGTPMKFTGNGLTIRGDAPAADKDFLMSQSQRTERFQLPTQLNIGFSYDVLAGPNKEKGKHLHRVTIAANFLSNAFGKDNIGGGLEYSFRELFMIRAGYKYEQGIFSTSNGQVDSRTNAHNGLAAGVTGNVPISKKKEDSDTRRILSIDYAYRVSNPFSGTHTIGARINL